MGVPKFYRWLSERYPKINQIVSDTSLIPEFDNLYLDMNGILHGCTHPNDDSLSKQLSERDVFLGVFHYIDRIVTHIVRPRRVLYMAIDGVAPRAKMNQQRSRRFRSAKDAAAARAEAAARGETVDDGEVFDSNCITPGTEFMAKVSAHLKYFIRKKIKEDPLWQRLTVIFSGHEVPGEGEHKIMQYIRDQRCAGAFAPNTRHCMYGQDADLILLGLVAHEPHFTLLREVVNFNNGRAGGARGAKNAVKLVMKTTADAQFQLLHLSVLREYLWVEFTLGMSAATASALSLERVVDDFVFITFLVGNDFLPHMPSLDIGEEAFALLFGIYRELAPAWRGGYLTRDGSIEDPDRLEQFLAAVGAKEDEIFATREIEEEGMRERQRRHGNRQNVPSEEDLDDEETRLQEAYEDAMLQVLGHVPEGSTPGQKDFKGRYYFEKFGITPVHTQVHSELRHQYVAGLQWCLAGCVSWEWFFPFHYVPMLSDLTGLRDMFGKVSFRLSKPFLPFEQLLGCLPAASAWCLPKPYALLMTSPDSPIADFYPADFKIDMNGKRNPWEAVNLLPFIDASRLFAAVHERCPVQLLTPEERKRNTYGAVLEYTYSEHATGTVVSCNPEIGLSDIRQCVSEEKELPWSIESHTSFTSALPLGSTIPLAGFPSLNVLPIEQAEAKPIKLNVFGSESRYSTMVLTLRRPRGLPSAEQLAPRVIGRSVFVNWPLLHEAKNAYLKGRATPGSGGVDVGPIGSRLTVRPLQGTSCRDVTAYMFGSEEADVPLHMALWQSPAPDPRFEERGAPSLDVRLPVGSRVLCLTAAGAERQARGCVGRVKALTNGKVDVVVDLRPPEPPFGAAVAAAVQDRYYPAHAVCQRLRIRPDVFGKVVGTVNADPGRYDIGLNLKANGRYQLLGYSRCVLREQAAWSTADTVRIVGSAGEDAAEEVGAWEFTEAAARLVALYMTRYPQMFAALHTLEHGRSYEAGALFGPNAGEETLAEVKAWLESLPTAGLPRTPLTTKAMSKDAIRAVERAADVRQAVIVGEGRIVKREFKGVNASELLRANTIEATDAPLAQVSAATLEV
ncbi:XRN 5'-3' exonuclease N-terminus-domain-containing protein [Tribonema minus]|uniref:5'-3' exoribonuclease 2 n=1 Tax=Tribonema minus TaxID=303371 RepID=A0A835Z4G8_9STRA|nr:XRN 5'-3' exonuclease N-terminus-domain-containing protein [Tribonema minus]